MNDIKTTEPISISNVDKVSYLNNIKNGFKEVVTLINNTTINNEVSVNNAKKIVSLFLSTCSIGQKIYCNKLSGNECPKCPVRDICCNIKSNENKMHYGIAKICEIIRLSLKEDPNTKTIKNDNFSSIIKKMNESNITYNNLQDEINIWSK